ncbi:hypothetical protein Tco_0194260 [Tanacetum coccineum]
MKKVIEDVGDDEDFKSGSWVSATGYVNANGGIVSGCLGDIKNFLNNGKLDQVVAIVKSCSPNALGRITHEPMKRSSSWREKADVTLTCSLSDSNSTLKNHINHPHCEALKRVAESGQSSMSRDGSIFVYNPDVLREQFAGLVIQ